MGAPDIIRVGAGQSGSTRHHQSGSRSEWGHQTSSDISDLLPLRPHSGVMSGEVLRGDERPTEHQTSSQHHQRGELEMSGMNVSRRSFDAYVN